MANLHVLIHGEWHQASAGNAHRLLASALRERLHEPVYRHVPAPSLAVPGGILRGLVRSLIGGQRQAAGKPVAPQVP